MNYKRLKNKYLMNCFLRIFFLIGLFLGTINFTYSQNTTVEISKNKVVVGGKTYLLHIVKEKQTLFSISKAYGVALSELMEVNGKSQATVSINEVLRIPFIEGKKHPERTCSFAPTRGTGDF